MQIAVLSSAILAYSILMLLFRKRVMQSDHMDRRIRSVARIGASAAMDGNELNKPFAERFLKPAAQGFVKWLAGLLPQTDNPKLAASLRMAGIKLKPGEYIAIRFVVSFGLCIFILLCTVVLRAWIGILLMPLGLVAGLVLTRYVVTSMTRKRKQAIQKQLPEVLDLLSVSVEAGLGFDAALLRISERARGPLIDELNATYREITLGRSRSEALRNFEGRCGLEEIKTFVSAIIQAEQLGISLKSVLKSQAQQMRMLKRQKVEEKAMKAPVKIILPLVAFVFPVLFIVLLGPSIISIVGMKGLFGG